MRLLFQQVGEFEACRAAEKWLAQNGYSVGRMQAGSPRGILKGDIDIMKWRNLSAEERAALHGRMTGNMRHGPVTIVIGDEFAPRSTQTTEAA